ncbi:MAG: AMP-binding protein, partial [Planctomycetota bacterium]
MSVIHWLAQRTRATPDRPALEYDGQVRTWKELTDAVLRRGASLREAGVRAGDRVALFLPSGTRFVELVHAVTWCGAAVLPL